jgi:hypothetical protein
MQQTTPFAATHTTAFTTELTQLLAGARFPVTLTTAEIEQAVPAILRALGIAIVKHTCNGGRGPAYGRLAPPGVCTRCDELRAGDKARPAPAYAQEGARRTARNFGGYPTTPEISDHFRPGGPHALGECGPVCTFGDY